MKYSKKITKKSVKKYIPKKLPINKSTFTKMVKRVIASDAEKKFATQTSVLTSFNSAISASSELYPMLPDVSRGDESYQRNGDCIRGTYLKINGVLRITNTATMPEPKTAFLYFLEDTRSKDYASGTTPSFLNDQGSPVFFDGTWSTSNLPVDTSRFKLIRKIKIKLTQSFAPGNTQTGVIDPQGTVMRFFSVKVPLKGRLLRYPTLSAQAQPENCNMFWCLGYVNYSGTVDVALTNVQAQITRILYFRDN